MTLQVGIVGYGKWGKNLGRALRQVWDARVGAICDPNPAVLADARLSDPNSRLFSDYGEFLDTDIEAVVIASPAEYHQAQTCEALAGGKHVFVEKPMTLDVTGLVDIQAAMMLTSSTPVLMVGHTYLYNDYVAWMKSLIDDGAMGRILYCTGAWLNWGTVRSDVDAFWNFYQHPLSIIAYLLDVWPQDIYAMGGRFMQPGIDDVSLVQAKFGRVVTQVAMSWLCPVKVRQLMVVGDRSTLLFDDVAKELRVIDGDSSVREYNSFGQFQLIRAAGRTIIPSVRYNEPLVNEMKHFVHCCLTGEEPRTGFEHGRNATLVMSRVKKL